MSSLFKQSLSKTAPPQRSQSRPLHTLSYDDRSSSDSSTSSQDSSASVNTIRPGEGEHIAPQTHWTAYFAQELFLDSERDGANAKYHAFITPPTNLQQGPLFICHHGAGSTAMSFATFARSLLRKLPGAGVLSLDARGHGSEILDQDGHPVADYQLQTLTRDTLEMINLVKTKLKWNALPPAVLVGHSLGGAVISQLAADYALENALIGFCVIDVVEGSAIEALTYMQTYLSSRPSMFPTIENAVQWHIKSRTIRDKESAEASVPALLTRTENNEFIWRTNLRQTIPFWDGWFKGMSQKFLQGRGAKLLILAGTDRLDKELMIGQMQGKFQLVVIPEAGHFVQEDVPEKTAQLLVDFYKRNDRSALVLPPKVSDLIAQGKKV